MQVVPPRSNFKDLIYKRTVKIKQENNKENIIVSILVGKLNNETLHKKKRKICLRFVLQEIWIGQSDQSTFYYFSRK